MARTRRLPPPDERQRASAIARRLAQRHRGGPPPRLAGGGTGAARTPGAGRLPAVHGLGLPVIAEGVEQQSEADLLDELGVAFQQGFLHGEPVRAADLPAVWSRPH